MSIPFGKPFIVGKELANIFQSVADNHLSGDGHFTHECHKWLECRHQSQRAMLTHSCTAALEMSAILCNIRPGDEIILPSYTFVSTANAFVLRGGVPVFIDIRPDTLNIDENLIAAAITKKTKAIVPVHYAGVACEMDTIMALAQSHDLFVIEDAAQALLSTYKGKPLGSIGHFGCLSFHETKNIISGEGGALLVNDEQFIERAEIIREKGTNRSRFFRGDVDKYTWVDIGSSYLPSELVGAFLYAQLEHADTITTTRKRIWQLYYQELLPLQEQELIRLPQYPADCVANGHLFYIIARSLKERTALISYLKEQEIHAVFHYVPLHSSPAGKKYGRVGSAMTVTDSISERLLRLPLYYEITDEDIFKVTMAIQQFYHQS